jgi:hypothetical protein
MADDATNAQDLSFAEEGVTDISALDQGMSLSRAHSLPLDLFRRMKVPYCLDESFPSAPSQAHCGIRHV